MHPDPDLLGSGLVGQSEGILRELMLKLFDHTPYDILIADFVMPRMNAPKLTRKCSLNRKLSRADLSISVVGKLASPSYKSRRCSLWLWQYALKF
jgi:CheY-like chemotaxis protein